MHACVSSMSLIQSAMRGFRAKSDAFSALAGTARTTERVVETKRRRVLVCDSSESTERAMVLAPRAANSLCSLATLPSSVVHTGVKSAGCCKQQEKGTRCQSGDSMRTESHRRNSVRAWRTEKKTTQSLPAHSWKLISPLDVAAVKSGAVSPMRMDMVEVVVVVVRRRKMTGGDFA